MKPIVALSNDFQYPVNFNWRFPDNLGPEIICFIYSFSVLILISNHISFPHTLTSSLWDLSEAERHLSSLQVLEPMEVENW